LLPSIELLKGRFAPACPIQRMRKTPATPQGFKVNPTLGGLAYSIRYRVTRIPRRAFGVPLHTYLGSTAPAAPDRTTKVSELEIVSAANHRYFDALLTLVASVHRFAPDQRTSVICLDLGLQPKQRKVLERIEGVSVRSIPKAIADEYPHLLEPRTFAWKLWLIHELAQGEHPFLYLDAGACFVRDPSEALSVILRQGILLVDDPTQINERWTHEAARAAMSATPSELAGHQVSAGIVGAAPSATTRSFFAEALGFGLDASCIRGGDSEHRHDQSILSILSERKGLPRVSLEQFGEGRGVIHEEQVIYVHRGEWLDHSGLRWAHPSLFQRFIGTLSTRCHART
jgi:hypothetical protein